MESLQDIYQQKDEENRKYCVCYICLVPTGMLLGVLGVFNNRVFSSPQALDVILRELGGLVLTFSLFIGLD